MTVTTASTGGPRDDRERQPWQPALTPKEAARLGIVKTLYAQLVVWARLVVDHHRSAGTARHLWEGTATHNDQFAVEYVEAGERLLTQQLEQRIDPALDEAEELLTGAEGSLAAAARHPLSTVTPESGVTYSGHEAVLLVAAHNAKIEADYRAGKQHHRRVAPWAKTVGRLLPWAEAAGLLGFVAYFLDVPLLRPWDDWLGFTLAVTIVAVVIYGQTRVAHHGAEKHNVAREAAAEENRHEADRAYGRRNLFVSLAAAIAVAITSGLVLRGTAVLGGDRPAVTVLLVFLAILTGLLMPLVSYLTIALDGSKVSRERDSATHDLDHDLAAFLEDTGSCRDDLADVAEIRNRLYEKDLPDVCRAVQAAVNRVRRPYTVARLLIGELADVPPASTAPAIEWDDRRQPSGAIGTGLPGASTVDLAPLLDRLRRLAKLDERRAALEQRLTDLPLHPWAKPDPGSSSATVER